MDLEHDQRMLEFVAFRFPMPHGQGLPDTPGAVEADAHGALVAGHFAPSRWFAPNPAPETVGRLAALAERGLGVVCEVTGKWSRVSLRGRDSRRLLSNAADLDLLFNERSVVATTLFDCPVILLQDRATWTVWVRRSVAEDFMAALCALGATRGS